MFGGKMVRHDSFIYEKSVKAREHSNSVFVEINRLDKETKKCLRRITYKGFGGWFTSLEKNFINAHAWADDKIKILEKYEEGGEEYFSLKKGL